MTVIFGPDIQLHVTGASAECELVPGGPDNGSGHITTLRIGVVVQHALSQGAKPLELVGTSEIKKMLGVGRQRVYQLTCRHNFPSPAASLDCGKVWFKSEVQEWIDRYRSSTLQQSSDI
ncbi:hypothetical protein GCM10009828_060940 [Actinoplanes couchii]|uniref:Uncharacterized protein n=2 Tax=Actinoplanes couchii TaxID=403638 RepID=A0ABQ3XQ50_9ACTN|nr:hypothetical protein Aco03nite_090440 [Actinoplanes couchii]